MLDDSLKTYASFKKSSLAVKFLSGCKKLVDTAIAKEEIRTI